MKLPTIAWDIVYGPWFDLTNRHSLAVLIGWMTSGKVSALWMGTPCQGLSRARRGPPGGKMPCALRSPLAVRGLANLKGRDRQALQASNFMADVAGRLEHLAYKLGIPGGEENPASSYLWQFPSRKRLVQRPEVETRTVDYCACGRPFRARTQLLFWHWRPPEQLTALRCVGRGICSFSGRAHDQLSGAQPGKNKFMTALKNAYPDMMCKILADSLSKVITRTQASRRWTQIRFGKQHNA